MALCCGAALVACQPSAEEEVVANASINQVPPTPRLPISDPPIDRAGLLQAVGQAASATALGQDDARQQRLLEGRVFKVGIRFGCAAPAPPSDGRPFSIDFNTDDRTLRIRAAPDLTPDHPLVATLASQGAEAVEGFWIPRPWLLQEGCPLVPPPATADAGNPALPKPADDMPASSSPPTLQRIGLAQFFTESDPRSGRRDKRPFEATKVLGTDEQPSPRGYNLVLSGRLKRPPHGRIIACRSGGLDVPPDCVISADFDRIWIERPDSKAIVAEWAS